MHLEQEDLLSLGDEDRAALAASGLERGTSSRSLWELCRAKTRRLCRLWPGVAELDEGDAMAPSRPR